MRTSAIGIAHLCASARVSVVAVNVCQAINALVILLTAQLARWARITAARLTAKH
jgi:hypothetical protein